MSSYDYIVAGAGAAGLSLLVQMIHSGKFNDKKILLIDRAPKNQNDRTWCFWEEKPGLFESIVYKEWTGMWFHGADGSSNLHDIHPYRYKMIRGIDFYDYCFSIIKKHPGIAVEYGDIENIHSSPEETFVLHNGNKVRADYIFSSIHHGNIKNDGYCFLWQHFKGWVIHSEREIFNPATATLMDFRVCQENDTRFVYVMPYNKRQALVEYTVFSESRLNEDEYEDGLQKYCLEHLSLKQNEYSIAAEEFGMIPMTNYDFPLSQHNIIYIGSAGGKTKASSGYTFRFIQKHSKQIVDALIKNTSPVIPQPSKKFNFYDSILLKILADKKLPGATIFTKMFENNKMSEVFKFLDNETSIGEDLKLISTLPKSQFIGAAFSLLLK